MIVPVLIRMWGKNVPVTTIKQGIVMKVLCIGELMVEMANTAGDTYIKSYAGDTFNVAYYMRSYAPKEWNIGYGTQLGIREDDKGAVRFIEKFGINTNAITYSADQTIGLFALSNHVNGEKQYGYWRGQSAAKSYFDTVHDFSDYDVVYLSGITGAITNNRENLVRSIQQTREKMAQQGKQGIIAYDFNHRLQLWSAEQAKTFAYALMPHCDVLKISDEELPWIFGENATVADLFTHAPHAEIIFTKGSGGSERWVNGRLDQICPAVKVNSVVDTSAAGDSFIALYLTTRLQGGTSHEALQNASLVASAVLGIKGSIAPLSALPKLTI